MSDKSEVTPRLDFEQRQQSMLIAESRSIDYDTAFELVALRTRITELEAAAEKAQEYISGVPTMAAMEAIRGSAKLSDELRALLQKGR